jgi:hypothetical protein
MKLRYIQTNSNIRLIIKLITNNNYITLVKHKFQLNEF